MSKQIETTIDRVERLLRSAGTRGITEASSKVIRLKDHIFRLRDRRGLSIKTSETRDGRVKWVLEA